MKRRFPVRGATAVVLVGLVAGLGPAYAQDPSQKPSSYMPVDIKNWSPSFALSDTSGARRSTGPPPSW
jgi:hypothetical protein